MRPSAWVPLPLARTAPYQIDRGHTVGGNADKTRVETACGIGRGGAGRRLGAHDAAARN